MTKEDMSKFHEDALKVLLQIAQNPSLDVGARVNAAESVVTYTRAELNR